MRIRPFQMCLLMRILQPLQPCPRVHVGNMIPTCVWTTKDRP